MVRVETYSTTVSAICWTQMHPNTSAIHRARVSATTGSGVPVKVVFTIPTRNV